MNLNYGYHEGDDFDETQLIQLRNENETLKRRLTEQSEKCNVLEHKLAEKKKELKATQKRCTDLENALSDKEAALAQLVASNNNNNSGIHSGHSPPAKLRQRKSSFFSIFSNDNSNDDQSAISDQFNHGYNVTGSPVSTIGSIDSNNTNILHQSLNNAMSPDNVSGDAFIYKGDSLMAMTWDEFEKYLKRGTSKQLYNCCKSIKKEGTELHTKYEKTYRDYLREHHDCEILRKKLKDFETNANAANDKNRNHKHHIKSLQKSLDKERKKLDKYKRSFEEYKAKAKQSKKKLSNDMKKLQDTIDLKEKYIERMCYKLAMYKDRLSQFEIPVFSEYVILLSPTDTQVAQYNAHYNLNLNHHTSMFRKHGTIDGSSPQLDAQLIEQGALKGDLNHDNSNSNSNNSDSNMEMKQSEENIVNPKLQAQAQAWVNAAFPKSKSKLIVKSKLIKKDKNGNIIIPTSNAQSLEYFINQNNVGNLHNDEMDNTLNDDILLQNSLIITQSKAKNLPLSAAISTPHRSYLESDVETKNGENNSWVDTNNGANALLLDNSGIESIVTAPKTVDENGMAIIEDASESDSVSEQNKNGMNNNGDDAGNSNSKMTGKHCGSGNSSIDTETDYATQTDATTKSDRRSRQRNQSGAGSISRNSSRNGGSRNGSKRRNKDKKSKNSQKKVTRHQSMSVVVTRKSNKIGNIGIDTQLLKQQKLNRKDKKHKKSEKGNKNDDNDTNNNNNNKNDKNNRNKNKKKKKEKSDSEEDSLDVDELELSSSSDEEFNTSQSDDLNNLDDINNELNDYHSDDANSVCSVASNVVTRYVKLLLVKYPGTHELFLILNKQDENQDFIEIFRKDFCDCQSIRKERREEDFCIEFNDIDLYFKADSASKAQAILLDLRGFLEQHTNNVRPDTPSPPPQPVIENLSLFFGA